MLRIFVFEEPYSVKLRLEGQLTSQTVPMLTQRWADVRGSLKGRRAILDLGDLNEFDDAGRSLLHWLAQSGARFSYAHPKLQALVAELSREGPGLAAILARLAQQVKTAVGGVVASLSDSAFYQSICSHLPSAIRPCGCRTA